MNTYLAIDEETKLMDSFNAESLEEAFKKALSVFGYKQSLFNQFKRLNTKKEWYQYDTVLILRKE